MRWCAEDLGLALRWHLWSTLSITAAADAYLPYGGKPGRHACGSQPCTLRWVLPEELLSRFTSTVVDW